MADGNVNHSSGAEKLPQRVIGEDWYQQRWAETSTAPFPRESLAKAECLIEAARGVAQVLIADIDAVDHNSENAWPKWETLTSGNRNGLGMALRFLLEEASMQMAKSRDE